MAPIQSFKQITVDGPASRAAATVISHEILVGVDNYTGPTTNKEVPTGAKVNSILIFNTFSNLVSISALLHYNVQILRSGQTGVTPGSVGGDSQRNQVIHTDMKFLGKEQNTNWQIRLKIPPMYQRIREGDKWFISYQVDAVFAAATQALYKFYR